MSTLVVLNRASVPAPLSGALESFGFVRRRNGFVLGKLRVRRDGDWITLSRPVPKDRDPLAEGGRLGLWKVVKRGNGARELFPLPVSMLTDPLHDASGWVDENDTDGASLFQQWLRAALATLARETPAGWSPPDNEALGLADGTRQFSVQHGSVLRQVELVRETGRLALQVSLADRIPNDLPLSRRRALRALLRHAQHTWHLVRAAVTEDHTARVEVDLTGLPAPLAAPLLRAGLGSLQWIVTGLAETAEFLAESETGGDALDLWSSSRRPPTKPKPNKANHGKPE